MKEKFAVVVMPSKHSGAFSEVAESVEEGLRFLGHDVLIAKAPIYDRRNIIFGSHLAPDFPYPTGSILYNLEQQWASNMLDAFKKYTVWDYSETHVEKLRAMGVVVKYVPIGYMPSLTRIEPCEEDIDVLFYGSVNDRRQKILSGLQTRGVKVKTLFGVYGSDRDALIARSKIVLNLHYYESQIFEIVRISYLLANKRFVISESGVEKSAEKAFTEGVVFSQYEKLIDTCVDYLNRPEDRLAIAKNGYRLMTAKRTDDYLCEALEIQTVRCKALPSTSNVLSLVMIVKDEAISIEETLLSCKPFIDRWVIVDTGSTDGTQEVIERTLKGVPGRLVTRPFVDFSTTRNAALDEETQATFVLMLSGGEILRNAPALRAFCDVHASDADSAYYVQVGLGAKRWDSGRLTRVAARWRYTGVVHEVLVGPNGEVPGMRVPDAWIEHIKDDISIERDQKRWRRDVHLLEAEMEREASTRTAFYLAQTYECLNDLPKALAAYDRRIEMGGWHEELFEARLRAARIRLSIVPEVGVIEMLEVYSAAPHRAESLYEIGLHYYRVGMLDVGLVFALRAAQLPYPEKDTLFVVESIYRWQAWDLVACCAGSDRKLGLDAARRALSGNPTDGRLQKNVETCERLLVS